MEANQNISLLGHMWNVVQGFHLINAVARDRTESCWVARDFMTPSTFTATAVDSKFEALHVVASRRHRVTSITCAISLSSPRLESFGGGSTGTAFTMQACQPTTLALRAARASHPRAYQCRNVHLQDVAITRTGKPILRISGGRSSLGGHTATVFGANGFLGRYIVHRLARRGNQVVVPYRDDMGKRHLKPTGDLGRVTFLEFDPRNTQSIEESVRHSDIVFNLIGKNYPTKNFSLHDVNVESVERIAEACAKYDVDRFIHVSSYNVDPNSPSEFFRTKVRLTRDARGHRLTIAG